MKYSYTKSPVNNDRLTLEINSSVITHALDYITIYGSAVDIYFKTELSTDEKDILDIIVASHSGAALPGAANEFTLSSSADSDSTPYFRLKTNPAGWTFLNRIIYLTSSTINSLINEKDYAGTSWNDITVKFFDVNNIELTTQEQVDAYCVRTTLIFEPTYNYAIKVSEVKALEAITNDIKLFIIMVPDVPAINGGQRLAQTGHNFKYDANIVINSPAAKELYYNAQVHSNKIVLHLKHSVGDKKLFKISIDHFYQ